VTKIVALDHLDNTTKTFAGPNVSALTLEDAEKFCQENGLGYCKVIGELVSPNTTDDDLKEETV